MLTSDDWTVYTLVCSMDLGRATQTCAFLLEIMICLMIRMSSDKEAICTV